MTRTPPYQFRLPTTFHFATAFHLATAFRFAAAFHRATRFRLPTRFRAATIGSGSVLLLAAASVLYSQQPSDAEKLIAAADCSGCHAADHQIVGPAYNSIAQRYAGQSDAVEKLAARVRDGGGGMTPHPNLTDAQRKTMVEWILSTAPPVTAGSSSPTTPELPFSPFAEGKPGKVTRDVFHGYQFFNSYCYRCHGTDATGGQLAPDLRRSLTNGMTQQAFMAVAMTGKAEKGMPSWAGFLTEEDVTHIYKYVKGRSLDLIPVGRPPSEQDR